MLKGTLLVDKLVKAADDVTCDAPHRSGAVEDDGDVGVVWVAHFGGLRVSSMATGYGGVAGGGWDFPIFAVAFAAGVWFTGMGPFARGCAQNARRTFTFDATSGRRERCDCGGVAAVCDVV